MRRLPLLLLCAFCYALVLSPGCGGGDDPVPDAGPPPPPPPVDSGVPDAGRPDSGVVDLTPPTVVSYSPADGAVAVPPETLFEVNFSEPMRIDRGTLQLQPGESLPNNGVFNVRPEDWDGAKKRVLFSIPGRLPVKTRLTASLGNFADLAGNPVPGVVSFTFTTSDGNPPRVTNSSPIENAASVPLDTQEVSFTFSEPMDTRVGTLVAGGGLSLGPTAWVGNQVVSAIITGGLVTNGVYTVRLDGFRNAYGKELNGVPTLGDGKLDFGTGPDITKPTVTRAAPEEGTTGVTPETNLFAVFTFSEPMDKTQGTAVLVDGTTRTTLTPATWSEDGFTVTYDVEFRLRHGAALRIELLGFRDRAANSLDATAVLGTNGALDFTTAPDTTKPAVISSNIPDGATNVYPLEVYATGASPATAYRKIFTFRFSEPMNTGITRVTLHEANNPTSFRAIDGLWTSPRDLRVTITPPAAGLLPMLDDFAYYLDPTGLKDPAGNSLDVTVGSLGNGRLEFRTLPNYALLNHACEHAVTLAPTAIAASISATSTSPRTDVPHTLYGVTLPSNGTSYSGFTRAQLNTDANYTFFLNRNTQVQITDPANSTVNVLVTQEQVVPACPEITHRATFHTPSGSPLLNVRMGPLPEAERVVRLIVETGF